MTVLRHAHTQSSHHIPRIPQLRYPHILLHVSATFTRTSIASLTSINYLMTECPNYECDDLHYDMNYSCLSHLLYDLTNYHRQDSIRTHSFSSSHTICFTRIKMFHSIFLARDCHRGGLSSFVLLYFTLIIIRIPASQHFVRTHMSLSCSACFRFWFCLVA